MRRRSRGSSLLLAGAMLAALVHPMAHAFGRVSVVCDLISQFQSVGLCISLLGLAASLGLRSRMAWPLGALVLLQSAPWISRVLPQQHTSPIAGPRPTKILVANILFVNQDYAPLRSLIERERPDIVGLLEVSNHHLRALSDIARDFPVRLDKPRHDSLGIALWLRNPADGPITLFHPTPQGSPMIEAQLQIAGRPTTFYLVHTQMPFVRLRFERGFAELAWLRWAVMSKRGSCIIAGDFNSTESSPHFEDLLRETGLRDSRLGFGSQPSWPLWSPLRIAIDHALASEDLIVVSRRLGPDIGSDHAPLLIELQARPGASESEASRAASRASQP